MDEHLDISTFKQEVRNMPQELEKMGVRERTLCAHAHPFSRKSLCEGFSLSSYKGAMLWTYSPHSDSQPAQV